MSEELRVNQAGDYFMGGASRIFLWHGLNLS